MTTVRVTYMVGDTVTNETINGDQVVEQLFDSGGRAILCVYRTGQVAEIVHYRRAERIHRIDWPDRRACPHPGCNLTAAAHAEDSR